MRNNGLRFSTKDYNNRICYIYDIHGIGVVYKMNDFPTAEDIEIVKFTTPVIHIESIDGKYLNDEQAESLKQQIISEHEVVERLKERIEYIERINPFSYMNERQVLVNVLKSILEGNK